MKTLKILLAIVYITGLILSIAVVAKISLSDSQNTGRYILCMFMGMAVVLFFFLLSVISIPKQSGLPKFENPTTPPPPLKTEELPIIKIRVERKIPAIEYQFHTAMDVEKYAEDNMARQLVQQLLDSHLIYQIKNEGKKDGTDCNTYLLWELNVVTPKRIYTHTRTRDKNSVSGLDIHSKVKGYHEGGEITNKNDL